MLALALQLMFRQPQILLVSIFQLTESHWAQLTGTRQLVTMDNKSLFASKNETAGGSAEFNGTHTFFIDTSADSTAQSGFMASNTTSTEIAITDFRLFGSDLYWEAADGTLLANFWATETETDGIWALMWDQPNNVLSRGTPVVIKSV